MSKVYVVQTPMRIVVDKITRETKAVSMFDIKPALKFGEIQIILGPGEMALFPEKAVKIIEKELINYNDNDYIIPIGDPVLIGAATAVAAAYNDGHVRFLRWDKHVKAYTVLDYNL